MNNKSILIISVISYFILLTLAIALYKQRIIILDAAFQLFHIVQSKALAIQVNRFGAAITQIFPLLGIKLGLSLQSVAILYSISFIVFYFGSFLITWFILDSPKIAVVILLFNTLITTHSFFWIQCELIQGVVFTLIYLAAIELQIKKGVVSDLFHTFSPIALIIIVFFYPLLPFVLIFGLIFINLQYKIKRSWLLSIGISYIVIYLIKILFFKTSYDTNAMAAANSLINLFPNYFDIQSNKKFAEWVLENYFFIGIFFVWIIFFYSFKKEYLKLALFIPSFIGFTFLINVSYFHGNSEQFYLEPQYSILVVFIAFPLVYDIMPKLKPRYSSLLLSIVVITCLGRILITEKIYSKRLDWYRSFLKANKDKMIVNQKNVPMDVLKMGWSSAEEFWLLSTIENKSTASIVIAGENDFDWINPSPQVFFIQGGVFKYQDMDRNYFLFKDTVSVYKKDKFY